MSVPSTPGQILTFRIRRYDVKGCQIKQNSIKLAIN